MNNKVLALLIAILAASSVFILSDSKNQKTSLETSYQEWKKEFKPFTRITSEQDSYRFKIFSQNLQKINKHNSNPSKSYTMGVNKFTTLTDQQIDTLYMNRIQPNPQFQHLLGYTPQVGINIDWVAYGAVSPVKDQGSCLAPYAFSAIGGIQAISVIYFKTQQEYSVQQIVDCSSSYGNNGCTGGNMQSSFQYIFAKGVNTWNSYPYVGRVQSCQASTGLFKIKGYSTITSCSNLDSSLAVRPISVAVDGRNFPSYRSGIFDNCGTTLSLPALLVGATDTYYRLKLSWGISFGESGYIRLIKANNVCGICTAGSYPLPN